MSGWRRSGDKLFQIRGPAAEKLRSPKRVRVLETMHVSTPAEYRRRRNLSEEARMQSSASHAATYKLARLACSRHGAQANGGPSRTGVMWSHRRVPVIRLAAAFCMDCSRRGS